MKTFLILFLFILYPLTMFAEIDERKIEEIISEIYSGNLDRFDKRISIVTEAYNSTHGWFGSKDIIETTFQKFGWTGLNNLINSSHGADLDIQVTAYKNSIKSGHQVLAVAHSQGNLFTYEAHESLDSWMQEIGVR